MILVIDNYDSFTFNLVQYLGEVTDCQIPIDVFRNDGISVEQIRELSPSHIILSPGPCTPNEAGVCMKLVSELYREIPILGVCLGHQAIGQALGGKIVRAPRVMHGKTSSISHYNEGLFCGVDNPFIATRYHSLVIEKETLPECLVATAWSEDGEIMGITHKSCPQLIGLQFHPESILTSVGKTLLSKFIEGKF